MSNITYIKYVLTQKGLDTFCHKFHIPDVVHPQLPGHNQTIHERRAGKIGVYTRLFEFANFWLLLSTFFIDVLGYFRINLSQLSVIMTAKVSHFEILCRVYNIEPTVGLFRCFYVNSKNKGWMSFSKRSDSSEMDLLAFIHVADPTKVKIVERERAGGEAKLLDSTIGHVVLLLPVAPSRSKSGLDGSVDMLFDENGGTDQGDSDTGGGHDAEIELVMAVVDAVAGNVTAERPKRPRKKRAAVADASDSSYPPKKLRRDHGTSSGVATGGKSPSVIKELLANSLLNVEREGDYHTNSVTRANLRTIGPAERSTILPPMMTEAVITTSVASVPSVPPDVVGPSHLPGQELLMGSREINSESLHEVFVPRWNVPNDTLLDDHDISLRGRDRSLSVRKDSLLKSRDEEIENLKAQVLLKEVEAKAACLRVQVSTAETAEKVRADELDALKQKSVALEDEKTSLNGKISELQSSVYAKDLELKDFNVDVSSLKSQNDNLVDQVHALETTCSSLRDQISGYERLKEQIQDFQDDQMNIVNDKVAKLDVKHLEMALHLEAKFYPHLLTTISGHRWLPTHGLKLALVKCVNSSEYLTALGVAISCAIKKGMQSALAAGIDHGKEGKSLADVAAYNHAAEADFNFAVQRFHEVDFPLLAELKSHKDVSVEDTMNLLRLEGHLVNAPGMSDLQPDVEQLMLPIHRENIAPQRSALVDVWVPLAKPLSAKNLTGAEGTSDNVPAAVATTTALSTTFASTSSIPLIIVDEYDVVGADDQEDA
uniref:Transposase (Putative), gypsy type n=1 Tax=Tanacetum cinerariifolium TaxID=118510 RepID=A0A6L2MIV1_TANCI|nr:transposase (putative), gypsy type [Tanacetum cinerariifolium]